jgi:FkbM family methyltransferase
MGEVFISYSQNFEDVILYRALKGVDKGFYIDVGAWDPVVDSVTKAFYDRGWRGINIEPVRAFYEKLLADRPEDVNLMVAVGSRNGLVRFFEVVNTGLSTTNEELAKRYMQEGYEVRELLVPCMRLADICKDYGVQEVHFLKIDVEGAEKEVLEGFDFSRIRPWIVIVEATEANTQEETFKDWESLLLNQNYEFVYYDGLNRFYVARERSELKEAFKLPPNLWDGFVRYHEWKLQREVEHAQAEREALARQVGELWEAVRRAEAERISQEAQLAELSRALNALQAEKEKLWAEREALARQVEELWEAVRRAEAERISQEAQLAELSRALNALQAEKEKLWAEREALARQVEELWEAVRRAEAERISQEAQLAELSRALNALQAEKEKLWAEREALARQVEELDRWLKAVYATVSWRITAPLRMAKTAAVSLVKGVRGILAKSGHRVSKVIFQLLAKIARWAARNPRLRSLGKKVLSKSPGLQVRVRGLIVQERLTGPAPQGLSQAEEIELSQTVREVLEELRRSFQQASS